MKIWTAGKNLTKLQYCLKSFYSELNEEGISDADYAHVQKVWKVFKIKNCGEYHDLYVQCDTLLLVDMFENFIEISVLTASGLA